MRMSNRRRKIDVDQDFQEWLDNIGKKVEEKNQEKTSRRKLTKDLANFFKGHINIEYDGSKFDINFVSGAGKKYEKKR